MKKADYEILTDSFENRLNNVLQEYGKIESQKIIECILRIQKRLGGKDTKEAIDHIQNGDVKACFAILMQYYDRWYLKSLIEKNKVDADMPN
jgi:tRNA 2-selenouridine synthase